MAQSKLAFQLPDELLVYHFEGEIDENGYVHLAQVRTTSAMTIFYYIPEDGLWATNIVRAYWKLHPGSHPHATLFFMLRYSFIKLPDAKN